ncbi:MAG: glycosyltransferase [Parvibaculaceae bacterium]
MTPAVAAILECVWPGLVVGGAALAVIPWLSRDVPAARVFVTGVSAALMLNYLTWRVAATVPPVGLSLDFLLGALFMLIEGLALTGGLISLFFFTRTHNRTAEVNAHLPWLLSQPVPPLIDVFICTYNEEESILERTIIGATAMDYRNFRVWVLDDGRRAWLKDLCERLGCNYLTRPNNAHAKAGNINNALKHVAKLRQPPDFISILDADFVPKSNFLTRAMCLFHAEDVGVVQTPQHFVNPDPIQVNLSAARVWPDEQRFFFDVIMASKDAWGAAFCCGTSSVLRFPALMGIGGFPTDSVTEDYLVTLRLKEAGYRTVYLNEPLTLGLAPEGLKEYITQRGRWCLGFMQIVRGRSGPFSTRSNLTFVDRLSLFESFLNWGATYAYRMLGILVPHFFLLGGVLAVQADIQTLLHYFLPFFCWQLVAMNWLAEGRVLPVMTDVCQLIVAPAVLKAAAIGLFKPKGQKFRVTAKGGDRDRRFIEWPLLRTFLALLLLTMLSIYWAFLQDPGSREHDSSVMALVWSWYNFIILTITCCVCIEQPRRRKSERFEIVEPVLLAMPEGVAERHLLDLSITGARISGISPVPLRGGIVIEVGGQRIEGVVVRDGDGSFAVRFEDTVANRITMIRHLYAGRAARAFGGVHAGGVGKAVIARIFG